VTPRLEVVEVVVDDLAASIAFYRRLGLDFPDGAESEGHVEAQLGAGLRLAFDTVEVIRSFDEHWSPPSGGHRMALAFNCGSPASVDATYGELLQAGARSHREPWDAFWGMRYAQVLDPDGNIVDLFAPLAE
jgi:uncharacterized glyoxalase superfamily protein PhnB